MNAELSLNEWCEQQLAALNETEHELRTLLRSFALLRNETRALAVS